MEIFIFIKMISHVSFIILVHQIVILSILIPTKLIITKIHDLIGLRFEQSEHKKSLGVRNITSIGARPNSLDPIVKGFHIPNSLDGQLY